VPEVGQITIIRIPVRQRGSGGTIRGTLVLASASLLGNPFYFQPMPWVTIVAEHGPRDERVEAIMRALRSPDARNTQPEEYLTQVALRIAAHSTGT